MKNTDSQDLESQKENLNSELNSDSAFERKKIEETKLREAMLDWKKKGNQQLVDACAEALKKNLIQQQNERFVEDEFTRGLQEKVNRLEAEKEYESINNNKPRLPSSNKSELKPIIDTQRYLDSKDSNEEAKFLSNIKQKKDNGKNFYIQIFIAFLIAELILYILS
tara:strand:+ start:207 stop:704 length:498 start_codon:yes stop_codon:yes gene_type:complete